MFSEKEKKKQSKKNKSYKSKKKDEEKDEEVIDAKYKNNHIADEIESEEDNMEMNQRSHDLSPLIAAHKYFEDNDSFDNDTKENKNNKKKKKKKKKNREDGQQGEENIDSDINKSNVEVKEEKGIVKGEYQLGSHNNLEEQNEKQREERKKQKKEAKMQKKEAKMQKKEAKMQKEETKMQKEEVRMQMEEMKMQEEKKKKKKVRFDEVEVRNEEILNYFINSYRNKISIEHDELCQVMTGKKFFDIERLAKNATDITHESLMLTNIQKEKETYCKQCGYIYNYDDYMYMFIKRFNITKLRKNYDTMGNSFNGNAYDFIGNSEFLHDNCIKCIYCGGIIDSIQMLDQWNGKSNYIELNSYREKYIFDKNKKNYWKNKITSLDKNMSLFKEDKNQAYNITYEKCTDCGNDFLHFINIQTRSADEGSTIIYFCPNCKKQTTVNN
ncbi:hypothetical protein, conserved [Plasmodium gonderi]|uniref:TFIIS-type domain-containing protein n=1 Tax=Plasmodium gonderi TaxID=77519 RepID=A0A1Y1JET9_PLAGO|nr:hypothetical protein, conserved [Plasmodium gonderi]GAW79252.1 hypothetical protein, conserved [Plasmodium gonderi]